MATSRADITQQIVDEVAAHKARLDQLLDSLVASEDEPATDLDTDIAKLAEESAPASEPPPPPPNPANFRTEGDFYAALGYCQHVNPFQGGDAPATEKARCQKGIAHHRELRGCNESGKPGPTIAVEDAIRALEPDAPRELRERCGYV